MLKGWVGWEGWAGGFGVCTCESERWENPAWQRGLWGRLSCYCLASRTYSWLLLFPVRRASGNPSCSSCETWAYTMMS